MWSFYVVGTLMVLGGIVHMLSTIDRLVSAAAGAVVFSGGLVLICLTALNATLEDILREMRSARQTPSLPRPPQAPLKPQDTPHAKNAAAGRLREP